MVVGGFAAVLYGAPTVTGDRRAAVRISEKSAAAVSRNLGRCRENRSTTGPAVETAAMKGAKPACAGWEERGVAGGRLGAFVAANLFAGLLSGGVSF
jgi:hypothetical protein